MPGALGKVREKPRGWWILTILAIAIALYGLRHAFLGERAFVAVLADSFRARPWGIFSHALLASIALAIGPFQFHRGLLMRRRALHRRLGQVYVVCAFLGGGVSGLYVAAYSHGGWITHLGFGLLAVFTGTATALAYLRIKARNIEAHRSWMIRGFALLFAAVTLRLWLPLLLALHGGDFTPAYQWVSWLCWVPNLLFAEWLIARRSARNPLSRTI
ncbi:hypothetical protein BH20VER1_BH20VER1_14840 [soil metagenome]